MWQTMFLLFHVRAAVAVAIIGMPEEEAGAAGMPEAAET
jgi:hypothetical protein